MVVDLTNAFMSECAQIPIATFQNLVLTFPEEWRGDKICYFGKIVYLWGKVSSDLDEMMKLSFIIVSK